MKNTILKTIYSTVVEDFGNTSDQFLIVLLDMSTSIKKSARAEVADHLKFLRQEVINELLMRDSDFINDHLHLIIDLICCE